MRPTLSKSESPSGLERLLPPPASSLQATTPLTDPFQPGLPERAPGKIQRRSQSVHDITVTPVDGDEPVDISVLAPLSRIRTGPGTPRQSKVSLSAQGISKSRPTTPDTSPCPSHEGSPRHSFLSPRARRMSVSRTQT